MTEGKKLYLTATRGLPGSGKSTWARGVVEKGNGRTVRINKDDLREMLHGGAWSREKEKLTVKAQQALVELALSEGTSVIVDDTNLEGNHLERWRQVADRTGAAFGVEDFTGVSLEECIRRDLRRQNSVGKDVIMRMYNAALRPKPAEPPEWVDGLPTAVISDMDGTAALMNGRRGPYEEHLCFDDDPNTPVVNALLAYKERGHAVIITSGRDEGRGRAETERWLRHWGVPCDLLLMRKAGDTRKDSVVKRELYEAHVRGRYNVEVVLDDRNQVVELWRSLGLPTWQVADGDF